MSDVAADPEPGSPNRRNRWRWPRLWVNPTSRIPDPSRHVSFEKFFSQAHEICSLAR